MSILGHIRPFVIISLLATSSTGKPAGTPTAAEWLHGSGKDLQSCLRGEVFDADGEPATTVKLTGSINSTASQVPLAPSMDGHRFKVWVPVNQSAWYSMWLKAASSNNDYVACKTFNAFELRQAAIDGLKLTLQAPTRHIDVKVVQKGQPVSGAQVKVELGFGADLQATTGVNGIARLDLLPRQEPRQLTAWTSDHRIGGFSFDRAAPHDPEASAQVVELNNCRDQKLRFVDERGKPVAGLNF